MSISVRYLQRHVYVNSMSKKISTFIHKIWHNNYLSVTSQLFVFSFTDFPRNYNINDVKTIFHIKGPKLTWNNRRIIFLQPFTRSHLLLNLLISIIFSQKNKFKFSSNYSCTYFFNNYKSFANCEVQVYRNVYSRTYCTLYCNFVFHLN